MPLVLLAADVSAETTFFDNPDDAFIMGGAPATGGAVIAGTTGRTTTGGGCTYEWNCTNWGKCLPSGKQGRHCANIGTCPDSYNTPATEQSCAYTAPPASEAVEEDNGPENETGEQAETAKQAGTGKMSVKEIADLALPYVIIMVPIIGFAAFYLKKDYLGKRVKRITAAGIIAGMGKSSGKKGARSRSPAASRNLHAHVKSGPVDVRDKVEKNQILTFLISNALYPADSVSIIRDVTKVISRPVYVTVNKPYDALIKTLKENGIDTQGFYFIDASSGNPDNELESSGANFEKVESANMTDMLLAVEKCLETKQFGGVIFDSISAFRTYHSEEMVIRFSRALVGKLRKYGVKGVFLCVKDDLKTSLMKNLNMLADHSVDVERKAGK